MTPLEVRGSLVDALQLDLIGPSGPLGNHKEVLTQSPSRWYLTGFLVPTDADEDQKCDPTSNDELDQAAEPAGLDDDNTPEKTAARRSYLPSSMGISVLLPAAANELDAVVRYGEYLRVEHEEGYKGPQHWQRVPREEVVSIKVAGKVPGNGIIPVPNSRGVELVWSIRGVPDADIDGGLPKGTRSLSLFVVNRRHPGGDDFRDEGFIFQVELEYRDQKQRLAVANEALNVVRLTGDACVSAFFAGAKKKERENRCEELFASVSDWYASGHDINRRGPIAASAASLRSGEHALPPFHWEIEFPEVFSRENGGFDAFVGNPPFAGKNTLIAGNRSGYVDWLKAIHDESHGSSDLVAHFFRRTFMNIRRGGTLGLIATNTVAQGDTRSTGLRWICQHDGAIYCARRRYGWPGLAAVVVSVVHIHRGEYAGVRRLDGREVDIITAYLFHMGGHDNPSTLTANQGLGFQGPQLGSLGFLLDTDDALLPEFAEIDDPRNGNATLAKPYFGGEDLNAKAIPVAPR